MDWYVDWGILLEYVRVLLAWPTIVLVLGLVFLSRFKEPITALINRVASIKIPGGAEVQMPLQMVANTLEEVSKTSAPVTAPIPPQPAGRAAPAEADQQARSEREKAALWEYRYLNQFFVPNTQLVLEWLANRNPTTYGTYDAWMMPVIQNPAERAAIINALENHHLVNVYRDRGNLIEVTPKGREYIGWRGPLEQFFKGRYGSAPPPATPTWSVQAAVAPTHNVSAEAAPSATESQTGT
jgi:hypothetical protein